MPQTKEKPTILSEILQRNINNIKDPSTAFLIFGCFFIFSVYSLTTKHYLIYEGRSLLMFLGSIFGVFYVPYFFYSTIKNKDKNLKYQEDLMNMIDNTPQKIRYIEKTNTGIGRARIYGLKLIDDEGCAYNIQTANKKEFKTLIEEIAMRNTFPQAQIVN